MGEIFYLVAPTINKHCSAIRSLLLKDFLLSTEAASLIGHLTVPFLARQAGRTFLVLKPIS